MVLSAVPQTACQAWKKRISFPRHKLGVWVLCLLKVVVYVFPPLSFLICLYSFIIGTFKGIEELVKYWYYLSQNLKFRSRLGPWGDNCPIRRLTGRYLFSFPELQKQPLVCLFFDSWHHSHTHYLLFPYPLSFAPFSKVALWFPGFLQLQPD